MGAHAEVGSGEGAESGAVLTPAPSKRTPGATVDPPILIDARKLYADVMELQRFECSAGANDPRYYALNKVLRLISEAPEYVATIAPKPAALPTRPASKGKKASERKVKR